MSAQRGVSSPLRSSHRPQLSCSGVSLGWTVALGFRMTQLQIQLLSFRSFLVSHVFSGCSCQSNQHHHTPIPDLTLISWTLFQIHRRLFQLKDHRTFFTTSISFTIFQPPISPSVGPSSYDPSSRCLIAGIVWTSLVSSWLISFWKSLRILTFSFTFGPPFKLEASGCSCLVLFVGFSRPTGMFRIFSGTSWIPLDVVDPSIRTFPWSMAFTCSSDRMSGGIS